MLEVVPEELTEGLVAAGRFRLLRRVGAGGMGEVWAATHLLTGKVVALKFLKPSRAADARSHARIALEARAASAVRHPNVAEIHDVAELESGLPFLVMDLLEGETLAARLAREGRLPVGVAAELLVPVLDAVMAAHAVGVVHRDLKPDNVFLCKRGDGVEVQVLDFGIAKVTETAGSGAAPLTSTGELLGTSLYMAPEQVFADSDVDGRADVWALGILLYEVLAGTAPTARAAVGQVMKAITVDDIRPLGEACPDLPAELARVVTRMLSRDRSKRPDLPTVRDALVRAASPRARGSRRGVAVWLAPAALVAFVGAAAGFYPPPRPASLALASGTLPVAVRVPTGTGERAASPPVASREPPHAATTLVAVAKVRGAEARSPGASPARENIFHESDAGAGTPAPSSGIILTDDRK